MFKKRTRPVNTREKSDSPLVVKPVAGEEGDETGGEAQEEEPT